MKSRLSSIVSHIIIYILFNNYILTMIQHCIYLLVITLFLNNRNFITNKIACNKMEDIYFFGIGLIIKFFVCSAASDFWKKVKLVFVFLIFRLPYNSFCKLSKRDVVFIWHFEIADICDFRALLEYLLQSFLRWRHNLSYMTVLNHINV